MNYLRSLIISEGAALLEWMDGWMELGAGAKRVFLLKERRSHLAEEGREREVNVLFSPCFHNFWCSVDFKNFSFPCYFKPLS